MLHTQKPGFDLLYCLNREREVKEGGKGEIKVGRWAGEASYLLSR